MATTTRAGGRRAGRPAGSPPNREAILASAWRVFGERGYDGATIRAIAADAGVDPALIHHYFGTKDRLLLMTMQNAAPVEGWIESLTARGVTDDLGERLIRMAFDAYEVVYRPVWAALLGLLRSASSDGDAAHVVRERFGAGGLSRMMEALGLSQPRLRATLVATEIVGLMLARFVLRLEPVASADLDTIVAWYAPTVQRYLTAPLPGGE
jgi:AcrR family transcriptional regulator